MFTTSPFQPTSEDPVLFTKFTTLDLVGTPDGDTMNPSDTEKVMSPVSTGTPSSTAVTGGSDIGSPGVPECPPSPIRAYNSVIVGEPVIGGEPVAGKAKEPKAKTKPYSKAPGNKKKRSGSQFESSIKREFKTLKSAQVTSAREIATSKIQYLEALNQINMEEIERLMQIRPGQEFLEILARIFIEASRPAPSECRRGNIAYPPLTDPKAHRLPFTIDWLIARGLVQKS